MYNNPYDISRIDRQIEDLQRIKASYQNMIPPQPVNNFINTQPTKPLFEARFTNENPADVLVQNKTAFINLKDNKLSIKEIDGEIKEYQIIPPKDEKDIRIQQLENEINILKENYINLQVNTMNTLNNTQPQKNVNSTITQPETTQVTTENNTQLEPVVYDLKNTDYSVNEQQTLGEKISSKLKFKK